MKNSQNYTTHMNQTFKNVPVVRLDSGAVRIPVELVDGIPASCSKRRVLRITMTRTSFYAWR